MCSTSFSRFDALTTTRTRSSSRYTRQSSTIVPWSLCIVEYCTWPGASLRTSLDVMKSMNATASGPVIMTSPMWLTSNTPHRPRTAWCSAVIPDGYARGISYPANGTILAPRATCRSYSAVRLSVVVVTRDKDDPIDTIDQQVTDVRATHRADDDPFSSAALHARRQA